MSGFFISLRIAVQNVLQHRRRSLFLALALAAVTGVLVLLNGLATGIRWTMLHTATTLTTGHLNVGGFFKIGASGGSPVVTRYHEVMKTVRHAVPEMRFAVERGRGWAKVIADRGSLQVGISGIDIRNEPQLKDVLTITSGKLDDLAQPNTILVFESQLKKLDVKVGDAVTLSEQTTRGTANTVDCRVAAIAKDIGLLSKWNVLVPNDTLRTLYQLRPDATGAIHIMLDDRRLGEVLAIADRLRRSLADAGHRVMDANGQSFWMKLETIGRESWTGQKLDVSTWEDELSFMMWTLQSLQGLTMVLMVILIAIVVAGIMNTMWIAIRERTREIGTLRAIGMHRRTVARMFLLESLLLGLMGTAAGAAAAAAIAAGINWLAIEVPVSVQLFLMSDRVRLDVTFQAALQSVVMLSLVTGLAALYPSIRAARLRPIEAMAHFA
jgi:putative ABC transport system permease protein